MLDIAKRVRESANPFPDGTGGIDVKRGLETIGERRKGNLLAAKHRLSGAAFFGRAVNESGRALESLVHLRLAALPFTLIATTV